MVAGLVDVWFVRIVDATEEPAPSQLLRREHLLGRLTSKVLGLEAAGATASSIASEAAAMASRRASTEGARRGSCFTSAKGRSRFAAQLQADHEPPPAQQIRTHLERPRQLRDQVGPSPRRSSTARCASSTAL